MTDDWETAYYLATAAKTLNQAEALLQEAYKTTNDMTIATRIAHVLQSIHYAQENLSEN